MCMRWNDHRRKPSSYFTCVAPAPPPGYRAAAAVTGQSRDGRFGRTRAGSMLLFVRVCSGNLHQTMSCCSASLRHNHPPRGLHQPGFLEPQGGRATPCPLDASVGESALPAAPHRQPLLPAGEKGKKTEPAALFQGLDLDIVGSARLAFLLGQPGLETSFPRLQLDLECHRRRAWR